MPVLLVTAALLLVALASHVVPPKYGRDAPPHYDSQEAHATSHPATTTPAPLSRQPGGASHPLAVLVPAYVLLGVIAAGLVWALVNVLTTRLRGGRREWRRAPGTDGDAAAEQLAARIGTAVHEGLEDLAQGPVADAIIACWLRLEDAAASAGIALRRSDTPAETIVRVLEVGSGRRVRPEPAQALAQLYREARFSRHVMGEPARAAARAALEDIRADLARRDEVLAPVAAPAGDAHA